MRHEILTGAHSSYKSRCEARAMSNKVQEMSENQMTVLLDVVVRCVKTRVCVYSKVRIRERGSGGM